MSRYRFELATPADDGELRAVLAATPMPGSIAVSFRREPSYFGAAVVDGRFRQTLAARDPQTRRIVGVASRSVGPRYVNGQPADVGYLSGLRVLEGHRGLGMLGRGYAFLRKLHADGRTPLYLTTIASDNQPALAALTAGRAGLPMYHYAGRYLTVAIGLSRGRKWESSCAGVETRPAHVDDVPVVLDFIRRVGPQRQFFPCYEARDFFSDEGVFRGLRPEELLLAFRGGQLVGTLGGWDPHAFRQIVVHDYGRLRRRLRPLYNVWAQLRGLPRLPRPNVPIRHLIAALPLVEGDDPLIFQELLGTLVQRTSGGPWEYLLIDALGRHKFADAYDPAAGVVRAGADKDRLRPGVAEIDDRRLRDPHVRFFFERNPGHIRGEELCCLARLARDNLTPAVRRVLGAEPRLAEPEP